MFEYLYCHCTTKLKSCLQSVAENVKMIHWPPAILDSLVDTNQLELKWNQNFQQLHPDFQMIHSNSTFNCYLLSLVKISKYLHLWK